MLRIATLVSSAAFLVLPLAGCSHRTPSSTQPSAQASHPVIVQIVGRERTIIVSSGPTGPVYSVRSAAGEMLVAPATLDELRASHPSLYQEIKTILAERVLAEHR